jgi:PAS domain-containing protein
MQTVLDNMGEGVALFDQDFRLRFINRQCIDFQDYPADVAYSARRATTSSAFRSSRAISDR